MSTEALRQTVRFPELTGNRYKNIDVALEKIMESYAGLKKWTKTGSGAYASNSFAVPGFSGYHYVLEIDIDHSVENGDCMIMSAALTPDISNKRDDNIDAIVPIYRYQHGTYSLYQHTFIVSKPFAITSKFKGKSEVSNKKFSVVFGQGRSAEYVLPVAKGQDRMDEVAQMAVHDLLIDRINHWDCYDDTQKVYTHMVFTEYDHPFSKKSYQGKINELSDSLNEFNLPRFILSDTNGFRLQFQEVNQHKTKEAFDSIYPIIKKGYRVDRTQNTMKIGGRKCW